MPSRTYGTSAVAVTAGGRIVLGGGLSGELTLWTAATRSASATER